MSRCHPAHSRVAPASDRRRENGVRALGLHSVELMALMTHTRALPQFPPGPPAHLLGGQRESHTAFGDYAPRPLFPRLLEDHIVGLEHPTICLWCPVTRFYVPSGSCPTWADARVCLQVDTGISVGLGRCLSGDGPAPLCPQLGSTWPRRIVRKAKAVSSVRLCPSST